MKRSLDCANFRRSSPFPGEWGCWCEEIGVVLPGNGQDPAAAVECGYFVKAEAPAAPVAKQGELF